MKIDKISITSLAKAVEFAADAIVITDREGHVLYVNPTFLRKTGYSVDEILGKKPSLWGSGMHSQEFYASMWKTILSGDTWRGEVVNRRKNGSTYDAILSIGVVFDEKGEIESFVGVHTEISEMKSLQRELAQANEILRELTIIDPLTGTYNRRFFDDMTKREWKTATRNNTPLALILIDIDHFKKYNDAYGHPIGDRCLMQVTQAMKQAVKRPQDSLCRYGGEEFAIILPNTSLEGAQTVAENVLSAVRSLKIPHEQSSVAEFVTVSLGIAVGVPTQGEMLAQLISNADGALYSAKSQGRNRFNVYDPLLDISKLKKAN